MRALALLALLALGCAPPGVEHAATTPDVRSLGAISIVLGEVVRPLDLSGSPDAAIDARRLTRAEHDLVALYEQSGIADHVVRTPDGASPPAYLVSYRVRSYRVHDHGPDPRFWGGIVVGGLTAGLGLLIGINSRDTSEHTYEIEVDVFDVRRATITNDHYDTSVGAPLMRRTYTGTMRTWVASGTSGPGGAELEAFLDAQGEEIARTMFALSVSDVRDAIGLATPTSGGEAP